MSEMIENNENGKLFEKSLETVMHESMMPYAEFIITDRALPRVEDGLKPVQRRILYAMNELGNMPDKPYKKCARIVGECLGKYHPHGDTSVYDALVRMAQSFNMGQVLVDGQGNYGSIDGDGAAAMRYTEARLAPLSLELLRDIDKDTVSFSSNFDDTLQEPDMLPGRFPNLLVNGANGIAIGLSTNIPPHNIGEVVDGVITYLQGRIKGKNATLNDLMACIPAPDFPGGGEIIPDEIEQAYKTGKGRITIRARFHIEREGERKNIVFTEFPYQVNKKEVLGRIAALMENKKDQYQDILDVVDESDREGVRGVVKLRRGANIPDIIKKLFKQTDLSKSYSFNMVAIADGKPKLMGLYEIISYYAEYQKKVIKKRTLFDLNKAKETEEILSGLLVAINNIDEVIRIIKKANNTQEAKSTLRLRFTLSEKQANAILEMRLRRLTALEVNDLKAQIAEIRKQIQYLTDIYQNDKRQYEVVVDELTQIKRKYRQPRRSVICKDAELCFAEIQEAQNKNVQGVLLRHNNGTVNFVTNRSLSASNRDVSAFDSDSAVIEMTPCIGNMIMYAFTDKGNYVRFYLEDMKETRLRDKGFSVKKLFKEAPEDEKIIKAFVVNEGDEENFIIAAIMDSGTVRYTSLQEYASNKAQYSPAIKLKEDEKVVAVEKVDKTLLMISGKGNAVRIDCSDPLVKGKMTMGTGFMKLDADDKIIYAGFVDDLAQIVYLSSEARAKKVFARDIPVVDKMRKGICVMKDLFFAGVAKDGGHLVVLYDNEELKYYEANEMLITDVYDRGDPLQIMAYRVQDACFSIVEI